MLFSHAKQLTNGTDRQSRVIVIGSGAIGLYVGSALAARGRTVVVVEAGDSHLGTFAEQSYMSVGRAHEGIRLARGRCLGGTTSLWGGQLVEFQPIDFAGRDWLPGSQWPVSYDEIAPYYRQTYQNLGLEPRVHHDDDVWRAISCVHPRIGDDFEVFLTRWLQIPNSAVMYADRIQHDPRMAVLTGHTAVGFRGAGPRIEAVRVVDNNGQSTWLEGSTFILAAGTIENARLLLHAAQDEYWQCPWRRNQNTGRYFQDHLGGRIGAVKPNDKRAFFDMFCTILCAGHKFQPKIRLRNEVQTRQRTFNTQAIFAFESKASEHLVYLKQFLRAAVFSQRFTNVGDLFRHGIGGMRYLLPLMWRYVRDHRIFIPSSSKVFLHVQAEHRSCPESRITIDKTVIDAYGLPRVVLDWRIGEDELASLRQFALQVQEALHSAGLAHLEIDPDLLSLKGQFLSRLTDTYHQAGGAVMGWSEEDGVVDRNLRVFGTENLYVGGASVFRTASNANVTFTAITLATRLVDHLSRSAPVN